MSKLNVRMYNVGFGDSFLILLPEKRSILVDAGFHSQGKGKFDGNALAKQIIADVTDAVGEPRVDVVVATHRHQDHIFAFNSEAWSNLTVGEVWLPWVEDRQNKEAMGLWKKQQRFAMQLSAALPSFALGAEEQASANFMLWNAGIDMPGFDVGGWSNAKALDCLHEGFARRMRTRPRFLPEKEAFPESFESPMLPGVRVHVLGPARDPDLIEELDPEADGETYRALALRAATLAGAAGGPIPPPFGENWQVKDDELGFRLEQSELERIDGLAQGADALFSAEKVDHMINSTSLVLMLQIGNARLLLPGDAEWGTWKRILENEEARTLLRGATFLKVGHHGSHNATPKTLLEKVLPRNIVAMVSTQKGTGNYRNNIPLTDLLDAFTANDIRYVRSDTNAALPVGFERHPEDKWIDLEMRC